MPRRFAFVLGSRPYCSAALSGLFLTAMSLASHAATLTVTDGSTYIGNGGGCSIARAMSYINAGANIEMPFNFCPASGTYGVDDAIVFAPGVAAITVTSNGVTYTDIPAIAKPIVIDGASGGAGRVEMIDGTGAFMAGFRVNANNVTIRNMAIHGFYPAAINVGAYSNITIQGNYLGVKPDGTTHTTGNVFGVNLDHSSYVLIGGSDAASRNVIGMENTAGINIQHSDHVQIFGNYLGVGADGYSDVGNCSADGSDFSCGAIVVNNLSHDIEIGSSAPGTGNVIGMNHGDGIHIAGNGSDGSTPTNVSVSGNLIGVGADGFTIRGNGGQASNYNCGVKIFAASDDVVNNTIGGSVPGAGNVIANSPYCGVLVFNGSRVANSATNIADIEGNSIHGNGTLGIDLSSSLYGDGVTANDANLHDGGANLYQNYPVLAHTWYTSANQLYVTGTLNSTVTASQSIRVEVFANATGENQGAVYLGQFGVSTNMSGVASFRDQGPFVLPAGAHDITLTVTTDNGTSEMSPGQTSTASSDILYANSYDSEQAPMP
jgi:hypothetical protein